MKTQGIPAKPERRDRLIRERVHDPYKVRRKLPEPALCPECGAIYQAGRWQWPKPKLRPEGAHEVVCQACHRMRDQYPAGELTLSGHFLEGHQTEILNLVRHVETLEKEEHALHRIMAIEALTDRVVITTTDIHLPRRIGQALFNAYRGDFDFAYDDGGYFMRATWHRD